MKYLLFLLFPFITFGQDVPIGYWKNYMSYQTADKVACANTKTYCVADGSLYFYDTQSNSINRMSKVNGLSDVGVSDIGYNKYNNQVVVIYENCNIDIIDEGLINNISDIERKEISGLKEINNIFFDNDIAYLASSFGLIVIDMIKLEIKDTYKIGLNANYESINQVAIKSDTIYCATSSGIYFAYKNNLFLSDFNQWQKDTIFENSSNTNDTFKNIVLFNNHLISVKDGDFDSLFIKNQKWEKYINIGFKNTVLGSNSNELAITDSSKIHLINQLGDDVQVITGFSNIRDCYYNNNELWVADKNLGLIKIKDNELAEVINVNSPFSNNSFNLYFNEKLYVSHGGHINFSVNQLNNDGVSIMDKYNEWVNYDFEKLNRARDIVSIAKIADKEYYASWYNGISVMEGGEHIIKYGYENTGGILDTTYYSNNRIQISDLKTDNNDNLWGLNSQVSNPLFVKTVNGEWHSFTMNQSLEGLYFDELIIDDLNQKWGIIYNKGLFVYNDNNTISNINDDEYKILNTTTGNGNLPTLEILSITKDLDGEIWIGTKEGIAVFYYPSTVFSGYNFDCQQILIQEGDYGQYLLSSESINDIKVDGANRKWIGTKKSGVYLLSDDGLSEIHHFTEENSPLPSNNIISIAINSSNGEVFFGTEKGLISFRSDATKGEEIQENTFVFPNPVKENYNGNIAIGNLYENAYVKITDISGNLVYETNANGGQANWNGKNIDNSRVGTGVYLVFSSNEIGQEKMVSKILFIK